jgi:hypothetical protein
MTPEDKREWIGRLDAGISRLQEIRRALRQ